MKIILFVSLSLAVLGLGQYFQATKISELSKKVRCLEFGTVYVGEDFCGKH